MPGVPEALQEPDDRVPEPGALNDAPVRSWEADGGLRLHARGGERHRRQQQNADRGTIPGANADQWEGHGEPTFIGSRTDRGRWPTASASMIHCRIVTAIATLVHPSYPSPIAKKSIATGSIAIATASFFHPI